MKKTASFLLVLFALVALKTSTAQDNPNEFYAGYSPGLTIQNISDGISDIGDDIFIGIFSNETSVSESSNSPGLFFVGYNRFLSPKFKIGLSASFIPVTTTTDIIYIDHSTSQYKVRDNFLTFMARADFQYVKKEYVSMYSGLAAGASFIHTEVISGDADVQDPSKVLFAFQLNAFGIRVGKGFAGFVEIGFGYNGIVCGGLSYQF